MKAPPLKAPFFAALAAAAFTLVPLAPALSQPGGSFHGHPVDLRPRVNLDASAWREVVQDRVVVVLYAERESPEPADGQAQVSRMLAPVLERLKGTPGIEVESAGFRTDPVWQQSRIVGWRTRGALKLTSEPSEAFNTLVGELATSLNVQSVSHHLSREAHLAVEHELIDEAVKAFHAKAEVAARALGFRGYELREVSIGGSGPIIPQPVQKTMMMARAADAAESVPLPGAEGRTTVTLSVHGSVALVK